MRKDLTSQQSLLADFMSNISERCYRAGWMQNLEYILWDAVLHGQRQYGQNIVSLHDIEILQNLSNTANAWIVFDNKTEETAVDLVLWKEKFQQAVEQNPELVKG